MCDTEFVKCRTGFVIKIANILKDSWLITAVQETELKASSGYANTLEHGAISLF